MRISFFLVALCHLEETLYNEIEREELSVMGMPRELDIYACFLSFWEFFRLVIHEYKGTFCINAPKYLSEFLPSVSKTGRGEVFTSDEGDTSHRDEFVP